MTIVMIATAEPITMVFSWVYLLDILAPGERYYAIDIDIKNLADYIVLKSQGVHGLASDLSWLSRSLTKEFSGTCRNKTSYS
jgi:hypothetical protein